MMDTQGWLNGLLLNGHAPIAPLSNGEVACFNKKSVIEIFSGTQGERIAKINLPDNSEKDYSLLILSKIASTIKSLR